MGQCVVEPAGGLAGRSGKGGQPGRNRFRRCPGGLNNGTYGSLQDGDYWRRLRIVQEGTFWETGEYRFNWALENNQCQHGWAR